MSESSLAIDSLHLRLAAANGLIRRRRSIKPEQMSDEAVDPMILGNILENANWAPTHGMTQPWRFKVFAEEGREKLAEAAQRIYRSVTAKAEFRQDKYDGIATKIFAAPVVMVICLARQESGVIPEIEEVEAVACAVQNIHLTASAVGMAGYWSTPAFVYTDEMKAFLRLSQRDRCLGLFYLGWPKDKETWPQGKRSPIQERLEWFEQ